MGTSSKTSLCRAAVRLESVLGGVAVNLLDALFSALKFVGRWFLEERNPWLHHIFGNVETCLQNLRIPYCKPSHQFIFRHIQEVHFTTSSQLLRSQAKIPIQVPYLLYSTAWPRLIHAWRYVLVLLHLDQRDVLAIHLASVEAQLSRSQAFEQVLFFPNREVRPSNEELPHLILPKFTYEPPNARLA